MTDSAEKMELKPYPKLLSEQERKDLLKKAENLWSELQENKLGGFSGINRPFHIMHEFKRVIEDFGGRDVGLHWSKDMLDKAAAIVAPSRVTGDEVGARQEAVEYFTSMMVPYAEIFNPDMVRKQVAEKYLYTLIQASRPTQDSECQQCEWRRSNTVLPFRDRIRLALDAFTRKEKYQSVKDAQKGMVDFIMSYLCTANDIPAPPPEADRQRALEAFSRIQKYLVLHNVLGNTTIDDLLCVEQALTAAGENV